MLTINLVCADVCIEIWLNNTNTYRFLESQKAMAHPSAGRSVATDVGKALVIVTIRCTEGHLLYCLIHNETLQ